MDLNWKRLRKAALLRRILRILTGLALLFALFLFACNYYVAEYSRSYLYDSLEDLPVNEAGVLLGTSRFTAAGTRNIYFRERMEAAVRLFEAGKIRTIIVSGDNRHQSYNEPREMLRELIKLGIPRDRIVMDFAGFRTLDSVIRAGEIFDQKSFTIISQKFQNERAVFIARHHGNEAVAYNAAGEANLRMILREYLSRPMCVLDVLVLGTMPRHLGTKVPLPRSPREESTAVPENAPESTPDPQPQGSPLPAGQDLS